MKCLSVAQDGEYRADEETVVFTMVRTPDQQWQDEELTDAGKNEGPEEKHRSSEENEHGPIAHGWAALTHFARDHVCRN